MKNLYRKKVIEHLSKYLGFTLIEIILVTAIIAIIIGVSFISIGNVLSKSRDSRRKQDVSMISKALELYYNDTRIYPTGLPAPGKPLTNPSVSSVVYMVKIPHDPSSNASYCYISDGTYYKLYANLENKNDKDAFPDGITQSCNDLAYNYGIASTNIILLAQDDSGKSQDSQFTQFEVDSSLLNWSNLESAQSLNTIPSPGKILEINLFYDSQIQPNLKIDSAYIKLGYAPNLPVVNPGYTILLTDSNGATIFSKVFLVPNTFMGPPPLPGETFTGIESGTVDKTTFTITIPWFVETKNIRILDSSGLEIASIDVSKITVVNNQPDFHSIKGDAVGLPKQSFLKKIIKDAAAAVINDGYVDITFVSEAYNGDFSKFHFDVNTFIQQLLTYEPFKRRSSNLYFHYIDNSTSLNCSYYGRCIICDNSKVTQAANTSGVPYDNLYVIVNNATYGGCAYRGLAAGYNGSPWGSQVFVHELGHSLTWLEDEYLYTNSPSNSLPKLNCYNGNPPNNAWQGIVSDFDYFAGCSYSNWYRSSYDSIMRSIDAYSFNPISQKYITETINDLSGEIVAITVIPTPANATPTSIKTPTPTLELSPMPTTTPTLIPTPTDDPNKLNIHGRFIDYFTHPPIAGVQLRPVGNVPSPVTTLSNANGEFMITIQTDQMNPFPMENHSMTFFYYPPCYYYSQAISVQRLSDGKLEVWSNMFDLKRGPVKYSVTGNRLDMGDITVWPATWFQLQLYSDIPVIYWIRFPEEGSATGHSKYETVASGTVSIPFEYSFRVEVIDQAGHTYYSPYRTESRSRECSRRAVLRFQNGSLIWE